MDSNVKKGKKGENLALEFFEKKGYKLLYRNWRSGRGEIDLIMEKENLCLFVEVKYRESDRYGLPEEAISDRKMEMLMQTAESFWEENPQYLQIRFDLLSILVDKTSQKTEYFHIEDIYF